MYLGKFTVSNLNLRPYEPISCKQVPVYYGIVQAHQSYLHFLKNFK